MGGAPDAARDGDDAATASNAITSTAVDDAAHCAKNAAIRVLPGLLMIRSRALLNPRALPRINAVTAIALRAILTEMPIVLVMTAVAG